MRVKPPIAVGLLKPLPPSCWVGAYVAATLASAGFYGWLAWRLKKGESGQIVFRRAVLWFAGVGILAASLLPALMAVDFLAFQVWLAGLFLIPGFFKRFRWLVNDLIGGAPERWKNSVKESLRARYRASRLNAWITGARSWWDGLPGRQRCIVDLAVSLGLVIFAIYVFRRGRLP
ncbi:MAG: hypothetical protein ACPL3S_01140 [Halothiobacillaceae bacterium]